MMGCRRKTQLTLGVLAVSLLTWSGCAQAATSTRSAPPAKQTQPPVAASPAAPTPPPTSGLTLSVSDATVARQVSFAYALHNDLWVSFHGAPLQQMTHFGLDAQTQVDWSLVWSPDGSKLLVGQSTFGSQQAVGWLLSLPAGTLTQLPLACLGPCAWLGERYIVAPTGGGSHYMQVGLFDLQSQRMLATALDAQRIAVTNLEARSSAVYFTPYDLPLPPMPQDGVVKRFDLATNTITTAYTVPGPLITQGIPLFGAWDVSATGGQLVVSLGFGSPEHCPQSACYTYYQDRAGTIAMVFPSHQSQPAWGGVYNPTIAPDGKTVAGITGYGYSATQLSLIQQAVPSEPERTCPIPGPPEPNERRRARLDGDGRWHPHAAAATG